MHTAAICFDPEKLSKMEKKRTCVSQDQVRSIIYERTNEDLEGGAVWDVFRRQDVPKWEQYLEKHSVAPLHERTLHLTEGHKRKLNQEYGIIPWTFVQRLGDVVFIPAGCIHQIRNLKSCISIVANFIAPESVGECISLFAKDDKLEVNEMDIQAIRKVVEYLGSIIAATSTSTSAPPPIAPTTIGSGEQNGANKPSLQQMRQGCEQMLLMLEQYDGHCLSPDMRDRRNYLMHEIRRVLNSIIRVIEDSSSSA